MYSTISSSNTSEMFAERISAQKAERAAFGNSVLAQVQGNYLVGGLKSDVYVCKDGRDDGRISFAEKLENFGKGLIAPIKNIFASPKNMAVTGLTVAAGAGLIALTGGAAAPVMVALGLVGGATHIASGLYKQATATTDAQAAQAWQQVGSGTFAVGVSAAGAKSSLKTAGVGNTSNMTTWQACVNCIKNAPNFFKHSVKTASPKVAVFMDGLKNKSNKGTSSTTVDGTLKRIGTSKTAKRGKAKTSNANPPRVIELPEKLSSTTEKATTGTSTSKVIELSGPVASETQSSSLPDVIELSDSNTPRLGLPAPKETPTFNGGETIEQQLLKRIKLPKSLISNSTKSNEILALPEHTSASETASSAVNDASTKSNTGFFKSLGSNFVSKMKDVLNLFGLFVD